MMGSTLVLRADILREWGDDEDADLADALTDHLSSWRALWSGRHRPEGLHLVGMTVNGDRAATALLRVVDAFDGATLVVVGLGASRARVQVTGGLYRTCAPLLVQAAKDLRCPIVEVIVRDGARERLLRQADRLDWDRVGVIYRAWV